jgi:hypothetical protein
MGSIIGVIVGVFLILNGLWIRRSPNEKILMKGFFVSKKAWHYYFGGGIAIIAFSIFFLIKSI